MESYICPVCKGVGLVSYLWNEKEIEASASATPIYDFEDCYACAGLGYIEGFEAGFVGNLQDRIDTLEKEIAMLDELYGGEK